MSDSDRQSDYLSRPDAKGYFKVLDVLNRWDPIGVYKYPNCPTDEYDAYAPRLVRMLDAGATAREVARWMGRVATREMGLSDSNAPRRRELARELVEFWREWKGISY